MKVVWKGKAFGNCHHLTLRPARSDSKDTSLSATSLSSLWHTLLLPLPEPPAVLRRGCTLSPRHLGPSPAARSHWQTPNFMLLGGLGQGLTSTDLSFYKTEI